MDVATIISAAAGVAATLAFIYLLIFGSKSAGAW